MSKFVFDIGSGTYLPTHLPTYPPTYLPTCLPTYLPTYLPNIQYVRLLNYDEIMVREKGIFQPNIDTKEIFMSSEKASLFPAFCAVVVN